MTDNPWIYWTGGDCPVARDVLVDVRFRIGIEDQRLANNFWWRHSHASSRGDIIAYRLHKAAPVADDGLVELDRRPDLYSVRQSRTYSDEEIERGARAYDREDAAQSGEPSPWDIYNLTDDYSEFKSCRIACMRAALEAMERKP